MEIVVTIIAFVAATILVFLARYLPAKIYLSWERSAAEFTEYRASTSYKSHNPSIRSALLGGLRRPSFFLVWGLSSTAITTSVMSFQGDELIAYLVFTFVLLLLVLIDLKTMLLPDELTFALIWTGLLWNASLGNVDPFNSALGAVIGYTFFWTFYKLYYVFTGRVGLGHGDFKLLAGIGAWLGYMLLLDVVLIAALIGCCHALVLKGFRLSKTPEIPFGPSLAFAALLVLHFDDFATQFISRSILHLL